LKDIVFPSGFGAEESTLPSSDFDPKSDWVLDFDIVQTNSHFIPENPYSTYYGGLKVEKKKQVDGSNRFWVERRIFTRQIGDECFASLGIGQSEI